MCQLFGQLFGQLSKKLKGKLEGKLRGKADGKMKNVPAFFMPAFRSAFGTGKPGKCEHPT